MANFTISISWLIKAVRFMIRYIWAWLTLPLRISDPEERRRKDAEERRQPCLSCGSKDTKLTDQRTAFNGQKWDNYNVFQCGSCSKEFHVF